MKLTIPSAQVAQELRAFLRGQDYTLKALSERVGSTSAQLPHQRTLPNLKERTRDPSGFNCLARWFLLGLPVPSSIVDAVVPLGIVEHFVEVGLLEFGDDQFAPTVQLLPFGDDSYAASDLYEVLFSTDSRAFVMALSPPARHLLRFAIRTPVASVLDLCAGCGIHAISASSHSERVVATDLNPRAMQYTKFNAALNGFDAVETRVGNGFQPVAGESFDRILCNPPFVLAPSKEFLFRDNDMELDHFCRALVREAPQHLNEDGLFQCAVEWVEIRGQSWVERIAQWCAGLDCDAWVLKANTQLPSNYAHRRLLELPPSSPAADQATYDQWMKYYREQQIRAIHGGLLFLRKRSGRSNWFHVEELSREPSKPMGDEVLRGFARRDFLHEHAHDDELLQATPMLAPGARLSSRSRCVDGQWQSQALYLELEGGFAQNLTMPSDMADFLCAFNGERSVLDLAEQLARQVDSEPEQVRAECLRITRDLLGRGFLVSR